MSLPEMIKDLVKDLQEDHPALMARSSVSAEAKKAMACIEILKDKRKINQDLPARSFIRVQSSFYILMMCKDTIKLCLRAGVLDSDREDRMRDRIEHISAAIRSCARAHDQMYSRTPGTVSMSGLAKDLDEAAVIAVDDALFCLSALAIHDDQKAEKMADEVMRALAR